MAKQDDYVRYTIRVPAELYERLQSAAGAKSVNAEIVARLEKSFTVGELMTDFDSQLGSVVGLLFDAKQRLIRERALQATLDILKHLIGIVVASDGIVDKPTLELMTVLFRSFGGDSGKDFEALLSEVRDASEELAESRKEPLAGFDAATADQIARLPAMRKRLGRGDPSE